MDDVVASSAMPRRRADWLAGSTRSHSITTGGGTPGSLMSYAIRPLLHIPLLFEIRDRFVGALEHLRRRFGDERTWNAATRPDDVDLFAAFERVMQLALDSRRQRWLAVRQFGHVAHDHVALIDHLEIAHVDLAHDVAG